MRLVPDKKTILFISHDATRTGAPILLLNLAKAMAETNNYDIRFLIKKPGYEMAAQFAAFNTLYATADHASARKKIGLSEYAIGNIRKSIEGADIVISNTITNGDILPVIRKYYKGPVYSYIHELEIAARTFTNEHDVKALLVYTDHYLVPSIAVKNHLQERYKIADDKISLLQYYIPPFSNENASSEKNNTLVIGGAGTIDWRKGPDLFLQVAYHTFQQKPGADIKFTWIGAVENAELVRLKYDVRKSGLQGKIEFKSLSSDMSSFYKSIDVFLLTSREDPYPLVVLEAADAGVPAICFNKAGGAPEFVQNAGAGICVDYMNVNAMAAAVLFYYENRERRMADGKAGRVSMLQTHQNSRYINNQLEAIISNTCNHLNTTN